MSGFEGEREGIWDEYDWERFLRQQDQRNQGADDALGSGTSDHADRPYLVPQC